MYWKDNKKNKLPVGNLFGVIGLLFPDSTTQDILVSTRHKFVETNSSFFHQVHKPHVDAVKEIETRLVSERINFKQLVKQLRKFAE
jgi:hypothetical protein